MLLPTYLKQPLSALAVCLAIFSTSAIAVPTAVSPPANILSRADGAASNDYSLHLRKATTAINDNFDASFSGNSSDNNFAISIRNNAGTVKQHGTVTKVVVSRQIPWSPYTLYAIMGVNSKSILMGWVYCQGNSLVTLWLEDTTGDTGFTPSTVTGTCNVANTTRNVQFSTPDQQIGIKLPLSYPTMDGGASLSLIAKGAGNVTLNNNPYDLVPFAIVDCSKCNAGNVDGGWMEIHSVMNGKKTNNVCLGIFYLPLKHTASISLSYMNCFNENIGDQSFRATYSIPENKNKAEFVVDEKEPDHLPVYN